MEGEQGFNTSPVTPNGRIIYQAKSVAPFLSYAISSACHMAPRTASHLDACAKKHSLPFDS
eukprot:1159437-Pelagomonas_calceolata.AAC.2